MKAKLSEYQKAANEKVTSGNKIANGDTLILTEADFKIQDDISKESKLFNRL